MKAALYEGKKKIRIVDIPKPTPQKGEVLVKIKYTGICGSDLESYKTGLYPPPVVMGHEIMGFIEELGAEVNKWKEGDRVAIDEVIPCGKCYSCQRGYTNICYEDYESIGIYQNGGFAEYISVPAHSLVKIPDTIPDKFCTIFDQIATGIFALRECNFLIGDTAVIIGLGTIGLFLLQSLKRAGARTIIAIEKNPYRLGVAKKFGPDVTINKIFLPKIRKATNRFGADFVFECTGAPAVINTASDMVCKGGTIVQIGICDEPFEFNYLPLIWNNNRIQGIMAYLREDFEFAINLVDNKFIDPEPIVTKIIPLDDIVEEGFEEAINPETNEIKILVEP
jgi:(R,R)-butanediol dehydrogenase/meso-butanediol dehydrogenase/diacetyl reductase